MHKLINYVIAAIWLVNGLFCKVLNLVPRHQKIVARILGDEYAEPITRLIGIAEIAMAAWILSGWFSKVNAVTQCLIIVLMNILEYIFAPDLLLWGRLNIIYAFLFALVILYNEFIIIKFK